jgi:hypothetical protein
MQQLHKDNHYVPKIYMRQWATKDKIPTYGLLVPHGNVPLWKLHSLRGIAVRRNLYTQIVRGTESDDLERWLDSEFEAPAKEALTNAVTGQRLTREDWKKLVRFAIAQDVRTPARLSEFLLRQSQVIPQLLDETIHDALDKLSQNKLHVDQGETANSIGFPLKISVEDQGDGQATLKAKIHVGRALWHFSLRHLLTETIEKIPYTGWSIVRPARGFSWPTSDNPLIRLNYIDEQRYNFDGGWSVPNGDVLLPLSPTHLLYRCAGRQSFPRDYRLDRATSERVIRIIIEHADRYVFAKEEFDIHEVRPRTVSLELCKQEQELWANWHVKQTKAEQG